MIDTAIRVIDRLIMLLRERQTNNRKLFADHIEPIFLDMTEVHRDYRDTFNALGKQAYEQPPSLDMMLDTLTERKIRLEPLRTKVYALGQEIKKPEMSHFPQQAREFLDQCLQYFQAASLRARQCDDHYSSYYSDLIANITDAKAEGDVSEPVMERLRDRLQEVRHILDQKWSETTSSYARARLTLLR